MDKKLPPAARAEMTRTGIDSVTYCELVRYKNSCFFRAFKNGKMAVIGALLVGIGLEDGLF